jgi:hypothetical protein
LAVLVREGSLRLVYGLLYRRRANPPTAREIALFLQASSIEMPVEDVLRGLREYFDIEAVGHADADRYHLRGWAVTMPVSTLTPISRRLRAETLTLGRCAMCGRTPLRHGVVLSVDLKFPPEWGGTNDRDNLWPLCEDCKEGRREFLQAYAPYSEEISRAAGFDEPQRRIGELLKAFDGRWVPSDLIGIVASAKEYQEDFQRRIRELRTLGWRIQARRRYHESPHVRVYYRLIHAEPWPDNIHAAIVRRSSKGKTQLQSYRI